MFLARVLKNGAVVDEYTSVVDRLVACSMSVSARRLINTKQLRNVVLATCHADVVPYLQPDYVLHVSKDPANGNLPRVRLVKNPDPSRKPRVMALLRPNAPRDDGKSLCLSQVRLNEAFVGLPIKQTIDCRGQGDQRQVLRSVVTIDRSIRTAMKVFDLNAQLLYRGLSEFTVATMHGFPHTADEFTIALVFGASGSGKTAFLRKHFGAPKTPGFHPNEPVICHFPSVTAGVEALEAVCLEPTDFLKPFKVRGVMWMGGLV